MIPLLTVAFFNEYSISWQEPDRLYYFSIEKKAEPQKETKVHRTAPPWLLDYTDNMELASQIKWTFGNLARCERAATHIEGNGPIGGIYIQKSSICISHQMARKVPTCPALHELAHAIQEYETGKTDHSQSFYWQLRKLVDVPGDRIEHCPELDTKHQLETPG